MLDGACRDGMTFEWTELAYQESIVGQHDVPDLPAVRAAGLRGAGGAVRELVAAARRHPDRADDAALGDRRRVADRRRQQRVHADQLPRAGRAGLQERHPDRRVRASSASTRARSPAGDSRRVPHPAAAGADDVGGVHHGRRAARVLVGRRRRDAPGDGHRGVRRHARRDVLRPLPHAGLLRRGRKAWPRASPAPAAHRRAACRRLLRPRRATDMSRSASRTHPCCACSAVQRLRGCKRRPYTAVRRRRR